MRRKQCNFSVILFSMKEIYYGVFRLIFPAQFTHQTILYFFQIAANYKTDIALPSMDINYLIFFLFDSFSIVQTHSFRKIASVPSSAATCQRVLPSLSVANNNLLFMCSVVSFSSAQFHNFWNTSKFPTYATQCQAVIPTLSVTNKILLFIFSFVNFDSVQFHNFCNKNSTCSEMLYQNWTKIKENLLNNYRLNYAYCELFTGRNMGFEKDFFIYIFVSL